ncbi:hypothetical protein [Streptomyces sp. 6-11-2]|uniref:hypothetical protein n=1 Tax=Streptomyces sp. 6-11-2 TaxID=2585753 RepID=UPI001143AF2E|nr:hypothetical protein [Streptomyces sp. 6-11-2]GED89348.1 hypothetical protein TNCT6_64330 [Streptomyces sp. 6-11-2]
MPFGSGDRAQVQRIIDQLGNLATDLAAVKQQVADQQHTIDQIRRDTTAAITNGLAEIRAVARDALARTNDIVTGPVASIGGELVTIRSAITQLDNQIRTQTANTPTPADTADPPEPETTPAPEPETPPEPAPTVEPQSAPEPPQPSDEPDTETLRAAAGISTATLHAHRDTWEFIVKHAGTDQHFHLPAEVQDAAGTILAKVSGPSLVAALTSLHRVSHTADDAGTRAIAAHLHERLVETVQEIVTRPHRGDGAEAVRIVIDDRAAPTDTDT